MKTIYRLQIEAGPVGVKQVDIARELSVSKPTVSVSLRRLEAEGFVEKQRNRSVKLTEKGIRIAQEITSRNEGIFVLLKGLGVNSETAAEDACNMEHAISDSSYRALMELGESYMKEGTSAVEETAGGEENLSC